MPRRCSICTHDRLSEINSALIGRQAFRAIADRYGVSKTALLRHHDDHLPASLLKAKDAKEAAQADALLERGNLDGERLWLRILEAIEELQATERPEGTVVQ